MPEWFTLRVLQLLMIPVLAVNSAHHARAQDTPAPATESEELTDRLVMLAIDDELRRSEAVDGHRIDVDVDEGIVTLSGHVNHMLAKQIAVGLAQRIRGVVSVLDEIDVNITQHDDEQTRNNIDSALQDNPATEMLKLDVTVDRGTVTLSGEVANSGQRTFVGEVAMGVVGVIEIQNNVTVERSPLNDQQMRAEIEGLIRYSTVLDDCEIDVEVHDGHAILRGKVANAAQRSHAALHAYHAGAKDVDSRGILVHWRHTNPLLRAKRYQAVDDDALKDAVERTFQHDPRLLSFDPIVTVSHGAVTLTGEVEHLTARNAAEQDARHTIGVRRVKNNLKVRLADSQPTDDEIVAFTRAAISRDPYVERHNLEIDCKNAHVGLYGVVDTEFEKNHAHWIASRQKGVVHVNDYLNVRKRWIPKSDAAIQAELREKLAYDFVDPNSQVTATVENGVAILQGTVDTWTMWQVAMDEAIAAGAREPHNMINVRYGAPSGPHYYGPHDYVPR